MAAAPFKVTCVIKNAQGQVKSIPLTGSDVNGEFLLFPSGASAMAISSVNASVIDMIYTAAGTDTSQAEVYINGITTGIKLFNGTNLYSTYFRQVMSAPISVPAGALISFKQLT